MTLPSDYREQVLAEARRWIGTPWRHRARVRGAGVDCAQYLIACHVGPGLLPDIDVGEYPPDWMLHRDEERFVAWIERYADPVRTPLPADMVLWRFGRCFSHAAIVVQWPQILHAYRRERGVVPGDGTKGALAGRVLRFYRLRDAVQGAPA